MTEPDCSCITGFTFDELDIACDDLESITSIQQFLVDNECSNACELRDGKNQYNHADAASFECFQAWSLVVQYHNQCPTGSVDEDMYHTFHDVCPDCLEPYYVHEGAPNCTLANASVCQNAAEQVGAVTYVRDNCVDACEGNCTAAWQMVESIHLLCDHNDLSVEFDEIFESGIEDTVCGDAIYCNVIDDGEDANCGSLANVDFAEYVDEYGALDVDSIVGDDDNSGAPELIFGMAAALSAVSAFFV